MMSNTDTTPHNPGRIDHAPAVAQQPATYRPQRTPLGYRRQAASLRRVEPLALITNHRPPMGRVLAEFGMLVGWFALWILNGLATALGVAALGSLLQSRGLAIGLDRQSWLVIGMVFHGFISAVEGHLWRSDYERPEGVANRVRAFFANADRLRLGLAVFIGAIDSLSTAWYLRRIILMVVDPMWGWTLVAGLVASLLALSGEPMIINFAGKLIALFRENEQ